MHTKFHAGSSWPHDLGLQDATAAAGSLGLFESHSSAMLEGSLQQPGRSGSDGRASAASAYTYLSSPDSETHEQYRMQRASMPQLRDFPGGASPQQMRYRSLSDEQEYPRGFPYGADGCAPPQHLGYAPLVKHGKYAPHRAERCTVRGEGQFLSFKPQSSASERRGSAWPPRPRQRSTIEDMRSCAPASTSTQCS